MYDAPLNPRQLSRRSVFYGPYMRLLDALCRNAKFQKLLGQDKPDDEKELDREYVLRFFAMKRNMLQYGRVRKAYFLNKACAFASLSVNGIFTCNLACQPPPDHLCL
jgi:hypothetical protein